MRIFLDTNVLLDIAERREPFFAASQEVLDRSDAPGFELFVAGHALATIFYFVERKAGGTAAFAMIRQFLDWAEVAPIGDAEARAALAYGMADYEDALQVAAAIACAADWLITREASGFVASTVPILSPDEFLRRFPAP